MHEPKRCLSTKDVRSFYDWLGARQDWQRFFEGPAYSELLRNGQFGSAGSVFELGCGTGAFALKLLNEHLPESASYVGVDLSQTMVGLAGKRLAGFGERAKVLLTDGSLRFGYPAASFDCFIANYVMDLLSPDDIVLAIGEAHHLLRPGGRLCLISLTYGRTLVSRAVTWAWLHLYIKNPRFVGGCRPLYLPEYIDEKLWQILHHNVVSSFGIASEAVIAQKLS